MFTENSLLVALYLCQPSVRAVLSQMMFGMDADLGDVRVVVKGDLVFVRTSQGSALVMDQLSTEATDAINAGVCGVVLVSAPVLYVAAYLDNARIPWAVVGDGFKDFARKQFFAATDYRTL